VLNGVKKGHEVAEDTPILENEIRGQGIFVSEYVHSLDPKKRITIPSEWRAQVGVPRSLYVVPDTSRKCLCVFTAAEMVHRLEKIRHHSMSDTKARDFARALASKSELLAWDTQGRIRIKDELLTFAELVNEVALVGAFDCFELWNPPNLKEAGGVDRASVQEAAKYVGF
jgi:MraZ protein